MTTDNPGRPNFLGRPAATPSAAAPHQAASPFSSSMPVVRPENSSFRPPPTSASRTMAPLSSSNPVSGSEATGFNPNMAVRFDNPPSAPQQVSQALNYFQSFPTPQFPTTAQTMPIRVPPAGPPNLAPPLQSNMPSQNQPSVGHSSTSIPSFVPPSQTPFQMVSPPQGYVAAPLYRLPLILDNREVIFHLLPYQVLQGCIQENRSNSRFLGLLQVFCRAW
ncbi:hypothetical protein Nepgr_029947 [Nepenthes gracilis]|uniref:Uncharacterized protein n=1 Tax=Nepenthes gracilis TaxID=150966 RepID=A0AAD3TF97_NEPGR|nr:hypothetical protein Nepgr_029947 [Nepenthes gracilis]